MPKVSQNIDNFLTSANINESKPALKDLGAYTLDYSPLAYPIVFFLSITSTAAISSIASVDFPTYAVIGILNATAGLDDTPALEFYQIVPDEDIDTSDLYNLPVYVIPSDFDENGNRVWKKIELAY